MPIRRQSGLGSSVKETLKQKDMGGVLFFGKVLKVYPKYHSADVQLISSRYGTMGTLSSSSENEGRYACRILERYAGFDSDLNMSFGSKSPIQVGCNVIVGFINNYKSQPVILGCLFDSDSAKNILPEEDIEEWREKYRSVAISRLQDYITINGLGEFELLNHNGAYITSSLEDLSEDFNEEDLQMGKDKSGKSRFSDVIEPLSIFAKVKTAIGSIRLLIKGLGGGIRLSQTTGESSVSYIELQNNGGFKVKIQTDSSKIDSEEEVSSKYSELSMNPETGEVTVLQTDGTKTNSIVLSMDSGVQITSSSEMKINNTEKISLSSDSVISIAAPEVDISV